MKTWLGWSAGIWLIVVAIALGAGTVGGVSDNIQYKDWFSVAMWGVFGPIGFSLAIAGAITLIKKVQSEE